MQRMTIPKITELQRSQIMQKYQGPSSLYNVAKELDIDLKTVIMHIYIAHRDPIKKTSVSAAERRKHECLLHGLDLLYSGGRWT